ncbi:MAG TPA: response regulator [Candidatus Sumerlaeota bacterium]|nr:MAG: Alkaline phosphatase synthesis transcriptional regulatory protein PhoP [candidate division BRC1 bacterium ADurb.BinA292]HOE97659.1 response regulator [Candidatus Sumerlaeota bacterium]HOR27601.1 response regulator [Candidatus Sumerlaeota bacterium]HPK02257.1 response regulator [Candidatus Sumerlaeota bacterium]
MATKVLLADDEEDVKVVLKMFLESKGYDIVTAYDGLDAIDQARTHKPDVILLDIMMPLVDGFEVCRKLKGDPETAEIPIIMLSAASHAESVQKGLDAGAAEYLIKPFEPEQLVKVLEDVVKA